MMMMKQSPQWHGKCTTYKQVVMITNARSHTRVARNRHRMYRPLHALDDNNNHKNSHGLGKPRFVQNNQKRVVVVAIKDSIGTRIMKARTWVKKLVINPLWTDLWKKPTSRLAFITGVYISIAGLAVVVLPKTVFSFFHIQSISDPLSNWNISSGWIRFIGMCGCLFGSYYIGAAISDAQCTSNAMVPFYVSTILGRLYLFIVLSSLVVMRCLPIQCFFLGVLNVLGALSMWRAMSITYKL